MPLDDPVVCHHGTPKSKAILITPSDTLDLPLIPSYLIVAGSGTLSVIPADDTSASPTPIPIGTWSGTIPIRVRRVMLTGTTATGISGWF